MHRKRYFKNWKIAKKNTSSEKIFKKKKKNSEKKTINFCVTPPSDFGGKCGKNIHFSFLTPNCSRKNILFFSRQPITLIGKNIQKVYFYTFFQLLYP